MKNIEESCKLVAETYYGEKGIWLYRAFEAINKELFDDALPYPHIVLALTPHGHCLASTLPADQRPPTIVIHPVLFGFLEKEKPWQIPKEWLGKRFVLDALIHECMHVSVHYRLGGYTGESSHNNPQWVGEVNRLAPLLGFNRVEAAISKVSRVPIEGEYTKTGKAKTKPQRTNTGNIPFEVVSTFPHSLRMHQKTAAQYYLKGDYPVSIKEL